MIGSFKCRRCKHNYNPDDKIDDWKCDAFPEGITEEKLMRITRDPYINCNNGIAFDSLVDSENEYRVEHMDELMKQLKYFEKLRGSE